MYCEIALSKENFTRARSAHALRDRPSDRTLSAECCRSQLQGKRIGLVLLLCSHGLPWDVIASKPVRMYCEIASP